MKFSGNVDDRPRNNCLNFSNALDFIENLTFGIPKILSLGALGIKQPTVICYVTLYYYCLESTLWV